MIHITKEFDEDNEEILNWYFTKGVSSDDISNLKSALLELDCRLKSIPAYFSLLNQQEFQLTYRRTKVLYIYKPSEAISSPQK